MSHPGVAFPRVACALVACALIGCGSSAQPAGSTGGNRGSGGAITATGGISGSGGQSSGGRPGTGGQSATGGQGVGGATASGGAGGRGGQSAGDAGADSAGATGGAGTGGASPADGGADRADGAPSDATGADAAPAFAPCPTTGACLIMPLGDSITDGFGVPGGYRIELFRQSLTDAKRITFVGRKVNGPASVTVGGQTTPFPQSHEGYSGYTIDDGTGVTGISPLVDGALSMFSPHIVLLQIGTNDVNRSIDLTNAANRLRALLDRMVLDAPNALIVIAKITPTTNDTTNGRVQTYNNAIPALVQSLVTAGKHILMVDMYAAFTASTTYKTALMNDELHPNTAGYLVMAQTWYAAIKGYLH